MFYNIHIVDFPDTGLLRLFPDDILRPFGTYAGNQWVFQRIIINNAFPGSDRRTSKVPGPEVAFLFRIATLIIRGFFIACLICLCAGCTNLFFQPSKDLIDNPNLTCFKYEDVHFTAPDGVNLHGWLINGKGYHKGIILFLHGNAQNISTHVSNVLWLAAEGFDVFAFDYRGYGRSEGRPSIEGVHEDARAALEYTINRPEFGKEKIVVLGQSLGGAIAIFTVAHLPDKSRIAAVIADSTFAGYRMIARETLAGIFFTWPFQYPLSMLINDDYSPVKCIKDLSSVPVLILHGKRDRVVPPHHGEILYTAALPPREIIESDVVGHINLFSDPLNREKLLNFLSQVTSGTASQ